MSMDCKRPEKAWSILYKITGKIVLRENRGLCTKTITPKCSLSQSGFANKPLE